MKNLVLKEKGELPISTVASFERQLSDIKKYIREGIERFQKRYPKNEELQEEILYFFEKIDDAQCSNDIINIVVSLCESDKFKVEDTERGHY